MDKIRNLIPKNSGGSKKEEEGTYDPDSYSQTTAHPSITSKLTGEGSHLNSATGNTDVTSSGTAPTTSGPHSSDLMNKADPSVDSNPSQSNTTSSDFANKAAGTAWSSQSQTGPGAFPQEDTSNPYAASSIDPRVDNVPRTEDTGVGNVPIGHNTTAQSSVPQTSTTSDTTGTSNSQGMMGKALGAIGLGGAAAKADSQPPTTTTGTDSYATPAQSSGIPSHHRKESIPTTAYPSGTLDSPRAVAPPVGAPAYGNPTAIADEPGLGDDTGRAAIGQTSTYGSHYLGSGEPTSSIADPNSSDPTTYRKPETSHLGRDVGVGAGIGAAGIGADSAYDGSREQPGVQSSLQSSAPTSTTAGEHAKFHDAATEGHQPGATSYGLGGTATSQGTDTTSDLHPGRDAAAVGAGAGALGVGTYEHEKHRGAQDTNTGATTGYSSSPGNTTGPQGYPTTTDTTSASQGYGTTPGSQSTSQPYDETGDRHLGRDAAVAGAGVGAVGVGAHEYSKHEAKEAEKEQKAHDKALAKEERHHQKALEKEEKHREKELAKEEKAHEHHSHRKEEAAAAGAVGTGTVGADEYDQHHDNVGAEQEEERKPSLIQRILHPRSSKASAQGETSGLAAADAADNRAFHEHGDASSKLSSNITPAGYAEAPTKGYASQVTGGTGTTALAQGGGRPSGSHITALGNVFESGDPSARSGSAVNHPTAEGHATANSSYAGAPSGGYASQVTEGTGTTALATGGSGEPVDTSTGGGNLTGHQHGIHGSGLTRESMTGQSGTGHQFGEITDHTRR